MYYKKKEINKITNKRAELNCRKLNVICISKYLYLVELSIQKYLIYINWDAIISCNGGCVFIVYVCFTEWIILKFSLMFSCPKYFCWRHHHRFRCKFKIICSKWHERQRMLLLLYHWSRIFYKPKCGKQIENWQFLSINSHTPIIIHYNVYIWIHPCGSNTCAFMCINKNMYGKCGETFFLYRKQI